MRVTPAGVTLQVVGGPILTPSSNPALRGVNLEVVGGITQLTDGGGTSRLTVVIDGRDYTM